MQTKINLLFLIMTICAVESAKILFILPIPFVEHQLVYKPLIENLHKNEHQITVITTDPGFREHEGIVYENITEIDLSFVYDLEFLNDLKNIDLEGSDMIKTVFNIMRKIYEAELKSPKVKELLQSNDQFYDVVIVDWSGSSSVMNIFAHHFKAPLIAITHGEAFPNVHEAFGNPNHPIKFPAVFLPFTEDLNIFQRVSSVLSTIWYRFYYYTEEIPLQNEIIKNVIYNDNPNASPDMWNIESNADLLLINSYEVLNNIRPSVPTTIYLGGIHQSLEKYPMSPSLSQFLVESDSAVYVNLNNPIQESSRIAKLLKSLENLQINIIWNSNSYFDVNTTARIYESSRFEQESILAHPKVNLHITDGGQRNIEDSIHYAVPVLGISYSSSLDQYLHKIEKFDCGIISYIDYENQQEFESKINNIQISPKYHKNILNLRNLLFDQPIGNSVERGTWWIDHVIRNRGTKHLQNENKSLGWMKFLMFDVLITVIIGFASILFLIAYLIHRVRKYSKSLPFEKVTRKAKLKSF